MVQINNLKVFIWCVLLFVLTFISACGTPKDLYNLNLEEAKEEMGEGAVLDKEVPPKSLVAITKLDKEIEDIDISTEKLENALDSELNDIDDNFVGEQNEALKEVGKDLENEMNNLKEKKKNVKQKLATLKDVYSVENVESVKDSLTDVVLRRFLEQNPGKTKLDSSEVAILSKELDEELDTYFTAVNNQILALTDSMDVIIRNENTLAFEVTVLQANNELAELFWYISNNTKFESGKSVLPREKTDLIYYDVERFVDSVVTRINRAHSKFLSADDIVNLTLMLSIDGYADSQGFKGSLKSRELNQELSDERAQTLQVIINNCLSKKLNDVDNGTINFLTPEFSVKGHGTKKPNLDKVTFNPEGKKDKNRRLVISQCIVIMN